VCNHEAPSVEAANQQWAGQVQFIGVAWFGDDAAFQGFIDRHGLTFPQISDDNGDVFSRYGVPSQPALVIIDPLGNVQQFSGAVERDRLDELLTAASS
jgi:peroxiredoxin